MINDTQQSKEPASAHCAWAAVELAPNGTIVSANPGFAECVGRRLAELVGTSVFSLLHTDDVSAAKALLDGTVGKPLELRFLTPDAEEKLLLIGASPVPTGSTRLFLCHNLTPHSRAARAAREAESVARAGALRYAEVIRSASDWIWETNAEFRYTYFSPNLEKLTSIVPQAIIGKRRDEIGDRSLEPEKWAEHLATLRARKPFRDFVYRSNGRHLWIKVSGTPIFGKDGEFTGYRGVASDVTGQIAAERAVAESERRLRELFEVASDWFWETDDEGRFTFLSTAWSRVTGQNPDEYMGRRRDEFGDQLENPEAWRDHLATLAARKPFRDFTYCLRSASGAWRWIRTSGVPAFDESGAFRGYRGAATDVTAEMEAIRRAQAFHQRFAEVIESVPASLMVHDAEDRLVICNSVTREYFPDAVHVLVPGKTFEDFARTQLESGAIPEAVGRVDQWLAERMHARRQQLSGKMQRYRSGRWLRIIERRMSDGGTVGIRIDVTELKEAEEKRLALEAQLHHSQKLEALGTLAGGVAHELNNMLVPLLALSKITAARLPAGSRERNNVETILSASEKARNLVGQILTFSRKEAPTRCQIDFAEIARDALKLLRASIPSTIKINEWIEPVPPILGDPASLPQVIINLVGNAAQAIGKNLGVITVEVCVASEAPLPTDPKWPIDMAIRASITDNGCGMDDDTLGRIFEPFFTTKPVGEGTGLGLSVVHGIVTQHGGRILVQSRIGEGTRFDVYLPARTLEPHAADNAL